MINIKVRQNLVISHKPNATIFLSIITFLFLFTSLSFDNKSLDFLFYKYSNYYFVSFSHSFEVTNKSDLLFEFHCPLYLFFIDIKYFFILLKAQLLH